MRLPQRDGCSGRRRARGDEGLGLSPVAVRRQRRALELLPRGQSQRAPESREPLVAATEVGKVEEPEAPIPTD
jgi:hypothetical protein